MFTLIETFTWNTRNGGCTSPLQSSSGRPTEKLVAGDRTTSAPQVPASAAAVVLEIQADLSHLGLPLASEGGRSSVDYVCEPLHALLHEERWR
jgi:hypothetical protein